ncbi:Importin subunit beta-1 [Triticum urartu]|uniref:Importin subunit beta-1 n=1 Tax=Triticum urartu TaxID=4572 RepID=M7YFK8_TRIUA|nr:Importin subunit beta-1 [Triticum urartu]
MAQHGASAAVQQGTLEVLGYVCEEFPPEHLEQDQAIPLLVPMLFETLLNEEGYHEHADNVRNISMIGAKCLGLIARTVGDAIVPLVMPFVKVNITNLDWHCREAATFTFSSILEGPSVEKLTPLVHARLDFLVNSMKDLNNQVIIQKLSNSDVMSVISQTADQLMFLFPCVFACPSSTVHEKAILAICQVAYGIREAGLQNKEEYQICSISVWVMGDICRAIEDKMQPFCDCIMTVLFKDLANIALAIGENVEKYLQCTMPVLQGAAELVVLDQSNEDTIVHHNQLRHGIFEAYSGILHDKSKTRILGRREYLFVRDESVTKAAVAALSDLADILGLIS